MAAFIIWSAVALALIGIGLSCWRSRKAVGFFTFIDAPRVTDVRGYNHAVARLWMLFACVFEVLGLPLMQLEQNNPLFLLIVLAVVFWSIALIFSFMRIEAKYRQ